MAGVRIRGPLPFLTQAEVDRAAMAAVREAGALGQSRAKAVLLSDTDSRGFVGRKDTGQAHAALGTSAPVLVRPGLARAVTGIGAPRDKIAAVLEEGRRPGARPPPSAPLVPWVRRKLASTLGAGLKGAKVTNAARARFARLQAKAARSGKTLGRGVGPKVSGVKAKDLDTEAKRVAFLIARSIGRKGTPGLRPFRKAGAYIQPKLEAIFRRHLSRVIAERGGKGPA